MRRQCWKPSGSQTTCYPQKPKYTLYPNRHVNIRKYSEEIEKSKAESAQFSDELAIEELNLKAFTESIHELGGQVDLWGWVTCGSILIGGTMMLLGFSLWYTKVQIYQDAILRKQAGEIKEQRR